MKSTTLVIFFALFSSIAFAQWQGTNPVYFNAGNIGIGTSTPGVWFGGAKTFEFSDIRPVLKLVSTTSTGLSTIVLTNSSVNSSTHYGEFHLNYAFDPNENDKSKLLFSPYPGANALIIQANGNLGIGTPSPNSRLVISDGSNNAISINPGSGASGLGFNRNVSDGAIFNSSISAWQFSARDDRFTLEGYNGVLHDLLTVLKNGNVGVGTIAPNQKFTVNGTIYGKEVKVDLSVPGPDYVFDDGYQLTSLDSIQSYINQNKHLPEVPSAKEMEANGINLSEMNMLLLKKVEELTLYLIEQQKIIRNQEKRIEKLEHQKD